MTSEKDAPAEMPGEEAVARLLCKLDGLNPDLPRSWFDEELLWTEWLEPARAVLDLFAPILAEKERERDEARQIVRDIYWMALRYADGRQTYAPGMCNDALRKAYDAGWLIHRHQSDPAFARDGASPEYRTLEARALAAEAALENALDALKPFSALADSYFYRYETRPGVFMESHEDDPDERAVYGINRVEITTGHLRRARAALAQIAAPGAAMERDYADEADPAGRITSALERAP